MSGNQKYAPFRPALTPEQRERVRKAKDPMEEYGGIAIEEAGRQLALLENTAAGQNAHSRPTVFPATQGEIAASARPSSVAGSILRNIATRELRFPPDCAAVCHCRSFL